MSLRESAVDVVRTLRGRGRQAYFVGGCVRDLLLGIEPADYDVATDATPQEVMLIFPETTPMEPVMVESSAKMVSAPHAT